MILMRCSEGDEPDLGLWMGPRIVSEAEPDAEADVEDTTADRAALVDFIEQFGFCGG